MKLSSVMVVDDNDADQFLCKIALEEYDPEIEILQAYDGEEALSILSSRQKIPDVIFLDINMPRMNGHEFLEAYNKLSKDKSSTIIMLTSSAQEIDRQKTLSYGFVKHYLLKPMEAEHLNKIVDQL